MISRLHYLIKRIFIFPIEIYRKFISPQTSPHCRFTPTCSRYAIEAIEEWGVIIGIGLAAWRILRCNPLFKGGYDPVPKRKNRKKDH